MVNPNSDSSNSSLDEGLDRPLVLAIVLVVLLILASAAVTAYNVHRLRADSALVDHTHQVIAALEAIMETTRDAESGQRGYIITGNAAYVKPYRGAPAIVEGLVERVNRLTADNPDQQARLPKVRERIKTRLDTLFANVQLREEKGFDAVQESIDTDRGKREMDSLRESIDEMQNAERSLLIVRTTQTTQMYYTSLTSIALGALLGLLSIFAFVWLLRRHWLGRAAAAAELWNQREQLRTTLASIGDAVIATDTAARVVFMNAAAASLTGWAADDVKGRPLKEVLRIINETSRAPAVNPVDRVLAEGIIIGLANHTLLVRKDGVEIPIDDTPPRSAILKAKSPAACSCSATSSNASRPKLRSTASWPRNSAEPSNCENSPMPR